MRHAPLRWGPFSECFSVVLRGQKELLNKMLLKTIDKC